MNEFINFARSHGLIISHIQCNKIIRCSTENKPRKKNGSYLYDGELFGWCMDYASHDTPIYFNSSRELTDQEKHDYAIKRDAERKVANKEKREGHAKAAIKARSMLGNQEVSNYMTRKGFKGVKTNVIYEEIDGEQQQVTVIPMFVNGQVVGAQKIYDDKKRFIFGQRTKNAYFKIGGGKQAFLVEGYASSVSLQLTLSKILSDYCIYVCFSANNILNLAQQHDQALVVADNDESKTGQNIAIKSRLKWTMPDKKGYDWNDYHRENEFSAVMKMKRFLIEVKK